jgi:hypothetical protein
VAGVLLSAAKEIAISRPTGNDTFQVLVLSERAMYSMN